MNSRVTVAGAGDAVPAWFAEVEATLSRFRPDSALSRLGAATGRWAVVPPLLFAAIELALQAARATGGAFDPTVLGALVAAGYSRSFELGQTRRRPPVPAGRWQEIRLEPKVGAVWLPPGVGIDLGGIGKGLAVDGALQRMQGYALVDAGGDIGVRTVDGTGPVLVDVEDPLHPEQILVSFALQRGGVATSSTLGRRWGRGLHHIIDPASGRPADTGVAAATVVAETTAWAEVLAKACIVLGPVRGLELLASQGCHGLLVSSTGERMQTPGMEAYFYGSA